MDSRDAPEPEEPVKGSYEWMLLLGWQDAICEYAMAPEGAVIDQGEEESDMEFLRR
jgi:hypothetical protein